MGASRRRRDAGRPAGDAGRPADDAVWERHSLYGEIPYRFPAGYALDFRPTLPPGALRGDPSKQVDYCAHCVPPKYFYVDQTLTCRECGGAFGWPAAVQRHWYEVLGLSAAAGPPTRCPGCRRERQVARTLARRLARAADAVRERPDDAGALLDFAQAMAEHGGRLGTGDLSRGVAAARKAARLDPRRHTAHFWEALCHDAAGRHARAAECYARFTKVARTTRGLRGLVGRADRRLVELRATDPPGAR
jgi:hypothetical protein